MQQRFTEKVMEELIDPKSKGGVTLSPYATGTGTTLWSAATHSTLNANSLTIGNTTLTEENIKRILKNQSATPIAGVTQTI